jgi:large subunit ribosomal protein L5
LPHWRWFCNRKKKSYLSSYGFTYSFVRSKAIPCVSKKAVAGFHLRENTPIGAKVTLRKERMDDLFLLFLVVVLPGLRDFHGVTTKSVDKAGNLTVGLQDVSVFPSLAPYTEMMKGKTGLQITFSCSAEDKEKGLLFWKTMGVPFIK